MAWKDVCVRDSFQSFQDSSNSRKKDLKRVRTNTQVSDMRFLHIDTYNPIILDGNWIFPFSQLILGIYFHL